MAGIGGPDRRHLRLGLTLPVEPPPSAWAFPTRDQLAAVGAGLPGELGPDDPEFGDQGPADFVGRGADLTPGTLLAAYRGGLFPMPVGRRGAPGWWCPVRRGVLVPEHLRVTRSLRKSSAHLSVTVDIAFEAVVEACARTPRPGGWISDGIADAYIALHRLGWAHSVEAWAVGGALVGGLYGVALGGLFAGESMFHDPVAGRDASKTALVHLCALLSDAGPGRLVDVQWLTPHLAGLGAVRTPRADYLARLPDVLALPLPPAWAG